MKQKGFLLIDLLVACSLLCLLFSIAYKYSSCLAQLRRAEDRAFAVDLARDQIELLKNNRCYVSASSADIPWLDTSQPMPVVKSGKIFTARTKAEKNEAGMVDVTVQINWKEAGRDEEVSLVTCMEEPNQPDI